MNHRPILNVHVCPNIKRHSLIGSNRNPWRNVNLCTDPHIANHIGEGVDVDTGIDRGFDKLLRPGRGGCGNVVDIYAKMIIILNLDHI